MRLIDTHFHLDLFEDPFNLVQSIEKEGIYTIAVTNLPEIFLVSSELTKGLTFVKTALGYHPEIVNRFPNQLEMFKKLLPSTRYIGEIGMDKYAPALDTIQKEVFSTIIELCARAGDKVLSIHSRGCEKEILDTIGGSFPGKIILHWYSGGIKELERAIDYGCYFSINLRMIESEKGRKIIAKIPQDRILTESDGPFIKHNGISATPLEMIATVEKLAELLNKPVNEIRILIHDNFRTLLSI